MEDFTKWEKSSVKVNVIIPIVFLAFAVGLFTIMFLIKPKPPEVTKRDAATSGEVERAAAPEEIDWENF